MKTRLYIDHTGYSPLALALSAAMKKQPTLSCYVLTAGLTVQTDSEGAYVEVDGYPHVYSSWIRGDDVRQVVIINTSSTAPCDPGTFLGQAWACLSVEFTPTGVMYYQLTVTAEELLTAQAFLDGILANQAEDSRTARWPH